MTNKEFRLELHEILHSDMPMSTISAMIMETIKSLECEPKKVWFIEQYDQWFSYSSRVSFGVFSSREKAVEAMYENYSKEALGKDAELYENGPNQWMSDVLSCGIKICEVEVNKFEEVC